MEAKTKCEKRKRESEREKVGREGGREIIQHFLMCSWSAENAGIQSVKVIL